MLMKMLNGVEVEMSAEEEAETRAFWAANEKIARDNAWLNNRVREYPSVPDQFDLLYHVGIDGWKAEIKKIKDKYPKPVNV